MKVNLYLFLFLFACNVLNAQDRWAPVGAEWNYSIFSSYHLDFEARLNITALKDTVVLDKNCRKIENILKDFNGFETNYYWYTYGENDSIFHYRPDCWDDFRLLYDFTAELTDSISSPDFCGGSYIQNRVDSISIVETTNESLSQWHLTPLDYGNRFNAVIENIGGVRHMFPQSDITTDGLFHYQLRCYTDNNLEYKLRDDCDFWGVVSNTKDLNNNKYFTLYPNPTEHYIKLLIQDFSEELTYTIFSINGKKVLKGEIDKNENSIQVDGLIPGMYILYISDGDNNYAHQKFVINK